MADQRDGPEDCQSENITSAKREERVGVQALIGKVYRCLWNGRTGHPQGPTCCLLDEGSWRRGWLRAKAAAGVGDLSGLERIRIMASQLEQRGPTAFQMFVTDAAVLDRCRARRSTEFRVPQSPFHTFFLHKVCAASILLTREHRCTITPGRRQ
jgi:hypothetical protein